jgi:Bacterial TSP3 repeat
MKPSRALAVIGIIVLSGFGLTAGARSGFQTVAATQLDYQSKASTPLAQSGCQLCHVKPTGDAPWNPFGLAVGSWRAKKQDVGQAIFSVLKYGGDTDRDGYPDVIERVAGTDAKSRDSKPTEKLDALLKKYDAALESGSLKLEADSDGDGVPDALEVFAGTLPGDPNSKPSESLETLRVNLEKAGGIKIYAPPGDR